MGIDKIMEEHGFKALSSCGGFEWYTKRIQYMGREAFITITADDELHMPESLDEPVVVSINDLDSGDELERPQRFDSIKSYLETL